MHDDPVADARDLVAELFPHARWALLAGSVTTAHRTAGSDLDIVVLLPDGDQRAPHRESRRFRGWPVELFVHDEQTLVHYLDKDLHERRPALPRMVATGVALTGDATAWQNRYVQILATGPAPLTDAERDRIRYALTDLLDDLVHATDPGERTVIAAAAWTAIAEQTLALANHWTGTGKWLLRELRDHDPRLADQWVDAHGDVVTTEALVRQVLRQAGGPLFAGYHVPGERPTR